MRTSAERGRPRRSPFFATLLLGGMLLSGLSASLGGCGAPVREGTTTQQQDRASDGSPPNASAAQPAPKVGNDEGQGGSCQQILERKMKEYDLRNEVDDLVHRLFEAMARGDLNTARTLVAPGVEIAPGKMTFQDAQGRKNEYTFPKDECLRLRGFEFSPDQSRGELSYENRRAEGRFAEIYVTVVRVGDGYRVSAILE
ncbi:MAG: hypothetical protein BLITH_1294 [Brockia lithotrophica]|uniref:Uncharacterized protein n=1 Tax=Brockia lithotrophica TaxID=933949 RepID=A0A2T5G648_9BACL|nr:MAG: hypothetical protein BLITH_1294 [Brockia lithotrophica]